MTSKDTILFQNDKYKVVKSGYGYGIDLYTVSGKWIAGTSQQKYIDKPEKFINVGVNSKMARLRKIRDRYIRALESTDRELAEIG